MHTVTNEEGTIEVGFDPADPDRALRVEHNGTTVIEPSPVGLPTPDGPFPSAYEFVESGTETIEEAFRTPHGKRRDHDHRATLATYTFAAEESDRPVDFEVRVAADGVAYRYRIGGEGSAIQSGGPQHSERSGFRFPLRTVSWLFRYDLDHEAVGKHHAARLADGEFTSPGLFQVGDSWVLTAEAGVDGSYAASRFATTEGETLYTFRTPDTTMHLEFPAATPWRVTMIGDLGTVAESSLVTELVGDAGRVDTQDIGPENAEEIGPKNVEGIDPEDADWIDPGRVAWSWWGDNESPADFDTQKQYAEYAAERGWEYVLVDAGWSDEWVPDLVAYADERGVEILLWTHWTQLNRAADRERRLDRWADWGVAGIKVDFMDADDQGRLQFYDAAMAATAERDLLINFHGSIVPTGLCRRWPHVMTYEGVKGAEHHQWTGLPPAHNTILPFTRNVLGPMDYTPVTFSAPDRLTSVGHELALSVVFESGLQHFADGIEEYAARPAAEWFLERVPAAWDETVLVGGQPGTEATFARRRGDEWFVGSITAGPAREVAAPLSFLDGERTVHVVCEDDAGESLDREERRLGPDDSLRVDVADNGGFCAYLPE